LSGIPRLFLEDEYYREKTHTYTCTAQIIVLGLTHCLTEGNAVDKPVAYC